MRKKLLIVIFSLMLVIGIAGTFWGSSIALAASSVWNNCPRNLVNDPYPGVCHDYIDTNKDKICDRSQSAPAVTSTTTTTVAGSSSPVSTGTVDVEVTAGTENSISRGTIYYFLPVLAGLMAAYCLTWILSAKKVLKTLTHRKIWNVILLISALVSILLGLILTLNIDYNTGISLPFNMTFWHVEAGIAMGVIAVFHILWHWRYFMTLVKVSSRAK